MARYSVNNYTVETLLSDIKSGNIAIPEMQRPFVWDSSKVRDLVDSLYKGFPVGYIIVRSFTLTAHWSAGGTVETTYSGSSALVSFDEDSWYSSTGITITPMRKGITAVTFSNSVDSNTFKVLIIVTD